MSHFLISLIVAFFSYQVLAGEVVIMNHGAPSWPLIVKNAESSIATGAKASALPKETTDWTSMSGWKRPKLVSGSVTHFDFGLATAEFKYQIVLLYGGSPNGQKGKYIGYASVIAKDVSVISADNPGDNLNSVELNTEVVIRSVGNIGTELEPIADMQLELISTLKRKRSGEKPYEQVKRVRYRLTGAGDVVKLPLRREFVPEVAKPKSLVGFASPVEVVNSWMGGNSESTKELGPSVSCPHPLNPSSGKPGNGIVGLPLPLVEANKILDHDQSFIATALPPGIRCWNQLTDWHEERRQFEYRWVNRFWWDFVVEGEVVWLAGAQDRRQRGRYIGFVSVKINKVSRGITRSLNISAHAPPAMISNVGTDEDPVSSVTLVLSSYLTNGGKTEAANWLVSVDGMGNISDVSREADQ